MAVFCPRCGGVISGATWWVGAFPCRCNQLEEPQWTTTETTTVQPAAVDLEEMRRVFREELKRLLDEMPGSDAERLARDYLEDLNDDATPAARDR